MIFFGSPVLAQFKKVFHLSKLQVWKSMEKREQSRLYGKIFVFRLFVIFSVLKYTINF